MDIFKIFSLNQIPKNVGSELADFITEADNSFNCIIKLHKQYLKDKYDEVKDKDKGKIYGEWAEGC